MLNNEKVLLVHPLGYKYRKNSVDISRLASVTPPLGLASIAAYLSQHSINCEIIDCYACPDAEKIIKDALLREKPAFIGFSCATSTFLDGLTIAGYAKKTPS
ncbi:hypothetical protein MTBBW1_80143 [Desulfamplus magnetovallimortis]|uniref:B12-binding domain-containing protein n=1 Tax=Desulfamplus magnetovallimortis TaxID=1246637 RepID=L0R4F9_9BACT|nr:cobalamin-dependent protein [Desulfamplus magnetovallimortis]CCO06749.1 hypothetical protein DEMABW1_80143 [Desulfamplus magnetovallimortis BW-1]SLM32800.1 hypothetical protein MTBBW1_80143 [Desulfamplus magnetovallimortis]